MKQGEIWIINLDPTIGSEMRKSRPAIIVNDNALGKLPLKVIVPLTDWKDRYNVAPWMVKIDPNKKNGLNKASAADCFQVRSVSMERITAKIGSINKKNLEQIKQGLSRVFSIS